MMNESAVTKLWVSFLYTGETESHRDTKEHNFTGKTELIGLQVTETIDDYIIYFTESFMASWYKEETL